MLVSYLYAINHYDDDDEIVSGFYAFRSDIDVAEHFEGRLESLRYLGPIDIEGFYDSEIDGDLEDVK